MTNKPIYLDELIERASKAAGNDNRLAKQLGINRQTVSNWRHGERPCPPADQALLASIAGLDAEAWGARALIAQHEGTPKGEMLKEALKKALVATGGAIALCGSAAAQAATDFIRCIDWLSTGRAHTPDFSLVRGTSWVDMGRAPYPPIFSPG